MKKRLEWLRLIKTSRYQMSSDTWSLTFVRRTKALMTLWAFQKLRKTIYPLTMETAIQRTLLRTMKRRYCLIEKKPLTIQRCSTNSGSSTRNELHDGTLYEMTHPSFNYYTMELVIHLSIKPFICQHWPTAHNLCAKFVTNDSWWLDVSQQPKAYDYDSTHISRYL